MTEIAFSTIMELSDALEAKKLSPVELLNDVLSRLEKVEPILNSFAAFDPEGALIDAKAAEGRQMAGQRLSVLDGIPTSIKDLIAQKGLPLRFGSRVTDDGPCQVDAPSVERLRKAGAVLLGKSTTSEFGCKPVGDSPLTGITRNPWNTDLTPGGSSGGAAAMVAAGIVPYAIGTDGGGSIRIPASFSGLFGIKAHNGRVPVYPVSATPNLAHVGPLSRTVVDSALVLQTISGPDWRDPFSVPQPVPDYLTATGDNRHLKIGWTPSLGDEQPSAEVLAKTYEAVEKLRMLGYRVEEVGKVMDDPLALWNAEFYAGVGTRLRGAVEGQPDLLDPTVLGLLKIAITQQMEDYYSKVFERYVFREKTLSFFNSYDLLICPTLPEVTFKAGLDTPDRFAGQHAASWLFNTYPFNLTGQPGASLPVGFTDDGLPVGLQIISRPYSETDILSVSQAYEREYGELDRRPPDLI